MDFLLCIQLIIGYLIIKGEENHQIQDSLKPLLYNRGEELWVNDLRVMGDIQECLIQEQKLDAISVVSLAISIEIVRRIIKRDRKENMKIRPY